MYGESFSHQQLTSVFWPTRTGIGIPVRPPRVKKSSLYGWTIGPRRIADSEVARKAKSILAKMLLLIVRVVGDRCRVIDEEVAGILTRPTHANLVQLLDLFSR